MINRATRLPQKHTNTVADPAVASLQGGQTVGTHGLPWPVEMLTMKKSRAQSATATKRPATAAKPKAQARIASKPASAKTPAKPARAKSAPVATSGKPAATSRRAATTKPSRVKDTPAPASNKATKPIAKAKSKPDTAPKTKSRTKPVIETPATAKPSTPKPMPAPIFKATPRPEPVIPAEKDISAKNKTGTIKDRLVLMVPEPHWLHAVWELSYQSILRAESALGPDWHGAKPILRLFDVTSQDTTSTSEATLRDIDIHGGVSHWYIDIPQPPRTYRADVGYLSKRGQFYMLARSNVVTPPKAGASEVLEDNWTQDVDKAGGAERVLAMSTGFESTNGPSQLKEFLEDQFKKPPREGSFGSGAIPSKLKKFFFDLDAELVVFGRTEPSATVTLQNERVPLRPDGSFTMRFSLPDSRQIIPAVSTSADGLEEQTIVLAVERNIKRLDVMTHDLNAEV
jgi:hypothetical protein